MIRYHRDLEQGSDAWLQARAGILTASEMCRIMTPTGRVADNDKSRAHIYELLAQRITGYVEPHYISDDMLRGATDEIEARALYEKHYGEVDAVGFITNDRFGFTIGYSPDGMVGDDGLIECKSRRQRFQVETFASGTMPVDYALQCQTGLLVTERRWLDFVSFSGGLPLFVLRVYPDPVMQEAIEEAATAFEARLTATWRKYEAGLAAQAKLIPTVRTVEEDMHL